MKTMPVQNQTTIHLLLFPALSYPISDYLKLNVLFELMGAVANEFELVVHAGPTLLEMIKLQCHIYIRHGLSNI